MIALSLTLPGMMLAEYTPGFFDIDFAREFSTWTIETFSKSDEDKITDSVSVRGGTSKGVEFEVEPKGFCVEALNTKLVKDDGVGNASNLSCWIEGTMWVLELLFRVT